ncbi:hypothetical protein SAMN05444156_1496 [Verrucomicrobium sp. GAS474]|uniref:hypothetical protein n=1 Tax=Verrucomicrobium sp. GAS474 TaxID=1882831 RepID=UPI00087BC6A8|nr:hypothetical protein [Verrucomicrobium sp. GAS474]SDU02235.1 hypothetical protein SAMN05444156_1496 [Verrucomicrobium sp. GAS474]
MRLLASLSVALVLLLGGCATVAGGNAEFNWIVSKEGADFNKSGPAQDVPDRHLGLGTRLRIIGSSGDYYKVQLVSGETGFVPTDAINMAPKEDSGTGQGLGSG